MAFALPLRGGRGAPLSTEFGRWLRYGWMALRLATLCICRPPKKPVQEQCASGSQKAPPHLPDEPYLCCLHRLLPTSHLQAPPSAARCGAHAPCSAGEGERDLDGRHPRADHRPSSARPASLYRSGQRAETAPIAAEAGSAGAANPAYPYRGNRCRLIPTPQPQCRPLDPAPGKSMD